MTCKKCGKENANDSHYCIQCGAPLFENSDINTAGAGNQPVAQNEAVAQNMNSLPNRTVEPEAKKTGRHSAGRGIIIACCAVLALVLVGVAAVILVRSQDNKTGYDEDFETINAQNQALWEHYQNSNSDSATESGSENSGEQTAKKPVFPDSSHKEEITVPTPSPSQPAAPVNNPCVYCGSTQHISENHPMCIICGSEEHMEHPMCSVCGSSTHTVHPACSVCGSLVHAVHPVCSVCGSTEHTEHLQPALPDITVDENYVPKCPVCGSQDHLFH